MELGRSLFQRLDHRCPHPEDCPDCKEWNEQISGDYGWTVHERTTSPLLTKWPRSGSLIKTDWAVLVPASAVLQFTGSGSSQQTLQSIYCTRRIFNMERKTSKPKRCGLPTGTWEAPIWEEKTQRNSPLPILPISLSTNGHTHPLHTRRRSSHTSFARNGSIYAAILIGVAELLLYPDENDWVETTDGILWAMHLLRMVR